MSQLIQTVTIVIKYRPNKNLVVVEHFNFFALE